MQIVGKKSFLLAELSMFLGFKNSFFLDQWLQRKENLRQGHGIQVSQADQVGRQVPNEKED